MSAPDRVPGTRACVVVTREGVKLCGNRAAFKSLRGSASTNATTAGSH